MDTQQTPGGGKPEGGRRGGVSLKVIAAAAGVSVGTVSRVLNAGSAEAPSRISAKTRQRITAVARRLRYRPNLVARGIQTGKTRTIGVLFPIFGSFFDSILTGICEELAARDYVCALQLQTTSDLEVHLQQVHQLVDRCVDAVITLPVLGVATDEHYRDVRDRKTPLIAIDRELRQVRADFVGTNDYLGGQIAAKHLLELGHRRFGHIAGELKVSTAQRRLEGFLQTIRGVPRATLKACEEPGYGDGYAGARELLLAPARPTAIFAANDPLARGIFQAAQELRLKVPRDLSILGFADMDYAASLGLTTLRQDGRAIGKAAAALAIARAEGRETSVAPKRVYLSPTLVVRSSTGPAPTLPHPSDDALESPATTPDSV